VAALTLLATACGPPAGHGAAPTAKPTSPTAGPSDAPGATLTIGLPGDPDNWNPLSARSPAAGPDGALTAVVDAVWPSAFVVGPGMAPSRNRDLLVSATQTASSPQTVEYRIDPHATWADGVPVTAADFVYTWEAQSGQARFRDTGGAAFTPRSTDGYRQVASVAPAPGDDDEVVVTFRSFDPDWRALFSPLLPAHVGRRVGFDTGFTDPVTSLVSAGPFLVQSYDPGVSVVLVRNPSWWGPPAGLAQVTVDFAGDARVATDSLLTDQLDAAAVAFGGAGVAAAEANTGLSVTSGPSATFDDLVFGRSLSGAPSLDLRRALALAVDRNTLASRAASEGMSGAGPVGNRALLPGEAGYRDDSARLGTGGVTQAERLLGAAGYSGIGSTLERGGRVVALTLAVDDASPFSSAEAAAVVSAGASLGIQVSEVPAGSAAELSIVARTVSPWPSDFASQYAGAGDPVLAADLASVDALPDGRARAAAVDAADAEAWAAAVDLPLLYQPSVFAVQRRYTGVGPNPAPDGPAWDIASWALPRHP
jgi:peptide/nickel transport system substrate-binding protein